MADLPIIRVPLDASSLEELTRVAREQLRGEFFVPWDEPFPGARVCVEATSAAVAQPARVRGVALVRAAIHEGRSGLIARFIHLDPDSIRVPMGGLAPLVRAPRGTPPRSQKITRPVPLAAKAAGGEDFEDPTHASPLPAQVAQSMKRREKPSVIRRSTPLAMSALPRPSDVPPPLAEQPPPDPERPVVTFSRRRTMKPGQISLAEIRRTAPSVHPPVTTAPPGSDRRIAVIAVAIAVVAVAVAALALVLLS